MFYSLDFSWDSEEDLWNKGIVPDLRGFRDMYIYILTGWRSCEFPNLLDWATVLITGYPVD
jgi:hypothetical protein